MTAAVGSIPLRRIDGTSTSLADYQGKVVLIVNVASKCGLTPQYEGLQSLYAQYRDQGLVILGFPANDFAGQEPGTDEEIQQFCQTNYSVDFPMFSKIAVTGESQHPLYRHLTETFPDAASNSGDSFRERLAGYGMTPNPKPGVLWNFEKFLVGKNGEVIGRFAPDVAPNDPLLTKAIERALGN